MEYWRGSAGANSKQSGREKQLGEAKFKPGAVRRSKNGNRRKGCGRSVPPALPGARFIANRLTDAALARLLDFRPHGVEIVSCGNDRKKQNQGASQRKQILERAVTIHTRSAARPAPQTVSGHGQQQPH